MNILFHKANITIFIIQAFVSSTIYKKYSLISFEIYIIPLIHLIHSLEVKMCKKWPKLGKHTYLWLGIRLPLCNE